MIAYRLIGTAVWLIPAGSRTPHQGQKSIVMPSVAGVGGVDLGFGTAEAVGGGGRPEDVKGPERG